MKTAIQQPEINQSDFFEFLAFKRFKGAGGSIVDLTGSNLQPLTFFGNLPLDVNHQEEGGLCIMAREGIGRIKAKGKCSCGQNFEEIKINVGRILACKACLIKGIISIPERYYIYLRWDGAPIRIFSDNNGDVLKDINTANDVITEIRQKIKKNEFSPDQYRKQDYQKLQFDRYAKEWLMNYKRLLEKDQISPSYEYKVCNVVNKHLIPKFGQKDIRKFIKADIKKFYEGLPQKLTTGTQRNILIILKKMFKDALDDGYIRLEHMPKFPKIKYEQGQTTWLTPEAQNIIYEKIPEEHKPLFFFIMHTGCRCGEARALQVGDIDWENRAVTICRTMSNEILRHKTKGKKDRILPLDDELYEKLKENRKLSGYVFTNQYGKFYSREEVSRIWNKALKDANAKYVTIHEWGRHSFATQAIERGVDIYPLQQWLGHSNIEMTEKYIKVVTKALEVVKRPSAKVKKLKKKDG